MSDLVKTTVKPLEEKITIKDLNRSEREQMIARRNAKEKEAAAAAAAQAAQAAQAATKEKAIAFMNEIHLAPGKRAEFMAKLRELGGDENALETIMNNNEYIEHLMRFEKQAIAFMNEIHLAQDKRAEFMAKFRELSALRGDEKALAEIMTYNGDFLKSLTKPSTTTTAAAAAAAAAGRSRSSKQDDDYNMMLQHYAPNNTPPSTSMSYEEWKQTQ